MKVQPDIDPTKAPPVGYFIIANQREEADTTIDVMKALGAVSRSWLILVILMVSGAAVGATVGWLLPNKYRAQVLVAPVNAAGSDAMSGLRSQVGGLAALAGVDLGGGGGRVEESFATLSSRGFAREFITENNLLPVFFAKRWDSATQKWRTGQKVPTLEDGVDLFSTSIRTVSEDKKTRLIAISVEWTAPEVVAQWANGLVDLVNKKLREDAIRDADQKVKYLKRELSSTTVVEQQQAIYRLMESQVNQAMMANVQREYAFRVVDPAVTPEKKASPKRLSILLVGAFVGFTGGFIALFVYYSIRSVGTSSANKTN